MKVVIIGAGVAGLGIGWRLAQSGQSVTVLERSQPACGATFAAAGMIAMVAELAEASEVEINFARHSKDLWPNFAEELEQETGTSVAFTQNGALMLESVRPAFLPPGTIWLDGAAVLAQVPMLTGGIIESAGAVWAPDEAQVDSRALGRTLAAAFVRAGGKLAPNEAVTAIEEKAGQAVAARTPFGFHAADLFILAAGAWSGLIENIPITPVKGQMIAFTPPLGTSPPSPVIWGNDIYAVPRVHSDGRGRLLIGATVEEAGFDTSLTGEARRSLRARAEAILPELKRWTLSEHWAGLRPRSPDGLPLLGPTATPNLFVATGQYRNGILFAPAIADHLRDLVLGRVTVISSFDPRRFG
jgi:glycine oxidase